MENHKQHGLKFWVKKYSLFNSFLYWWLLQVYYSLTINLFITKPLNYQWNWIFTKMMLK